MIERCPICDRPPAECGSFASRLDVTRPSLGENLVDCHEHAVGWRARALAAEKQVRHLENELVHYGAIVDWMEAAAEGKPVSDFAESMGAVRAVVELRERYDQAVAQFARVSAKSSTLLGHLQRYTRCICAGTRHCRDMLDGKLCTTLAELVVA